jgi:hypothetical protein
MHMVIDWHIHAEEAEFFERYPHYMDTFKKFWEPFVRLYHIDMFKMMNPAARSQAAHAHRRRRGPRRLHWARSRP